MDFHRVFQRCSELGAKAAFVTDGGVEAAIFKHAS
jgi:hypothetical protein